MKKLARLGAGLSFTFFLLSGLCILSASGLRINGENVIPTALGLVLVGVALFAGPMLWLAAERWGSKEDGK
jgi:hypothetical protein